MTIGIGAMCQMGEIAVIASDMRVSFPKNKIQPHDFTGKQWDFAVPFPLAACVAGKLGMCQPIVDELSHRLGKLGKQKGHIYCEHIENSIRDARSHTWRRYADWCIRMAYGGMTLGEWKRGELPHGKMHKIIHDEVAKFIDQLNFEAGLIVAGFLPDGNILFYRATGKYYIEATVAMGVHVIGSGGELAMNQLTKRGQTIEYGLPRTLLHISEALEEARKVRDGSVGKPMAYTILWSDGRMARINPTSAIFRDWRASYKDREDTSSLDGNPTAQAQLDMVLQVHMPTKLNSEKLKDRQ